MPTLAFSSRKRDLFEFVDEFRFLLIIAFEFGRRTSEYLGGADSFIADCGKTTSEDGFSNQGDGLAEIKCIDSSPFTSTLSSVYVF